MRSAAIVLSFLAVVAAQVLGPDEGPAGGILLQGVTVIDGSGAPAAPGRDILIKGDRIAAVGPTGTVEAPGARRVPLSGRFVTPGFVDMHVHVLNHPWDEKGQISPRWNRAGAMAMLRMLLDNGVTTIRDPGSETEAAVTWREAIARGKVEGPMLFTAGRILNEGDFDPEPFQPVATDDDVRREIRWQAALGVDAIKVYAGMTPSLLRVVVDEARKFRLPVLGHLQRTTWSEGAEIGSTRLSIQRHGQGRTSRRTSRPAMRRDCSAACTGSRTSTSTGPRWPP